MRIEQQRVVTYGSLLQVDLVANNKEGILLRICEPNLVNEVVPPLRQVLRV